jgi:site-specific DNA-methyltransferase (adenine-specific)
METAAQRLRCWRPKEYKVMPINLKCTKVEEGEEVELVGQNPFFVNEAHSIQLYQGDALALLRETKNEQFDLIFADPPYFLSNGGITCNSGQMVSVDKGEWDKAPSLEEIHNFNLEWLRECRRILKPDGAIWVSGTAHNIYSVGFAMQTLGYKILNDITWFKINPPPNLTCRYFTHATETILWARREEKGRHLFHYKEMKQENHGKQMQSLWSISPPKLHEKRYGKHPTQKPEALLSRIVRASSNQNDLVLDPFCGSGTTGVACARFNRRFVGFEIDESYLNLAVKRLMDEVTEQQHRLDLDYKLDEQQAKQIEIEIEWNE